jgi:hypothetical protein
MPEFILASLATAEVAPFYKAIVFARPIAPRAIAALKVQMRFPGRCSVFLESFAIFSQPLQQRDPILTPHLATYKGG